MDTPDPVLQQLKKLREGRGLTTDRLLASPAVLDALGETDAVEARDAILRLLAGMGDGRGVRALKVDFGLDVSELLGREPTTSEIDLLGERRAAYTVSAMSTASDSPASVNRS